MSKTASPSTSRPKALGARGKNKNYDRGVRVDGRFATATAYPRGYYLRALYRGTGYASNMGISRYSRR